MTSKKRIIVSYNAHFLEWLHVRAPLCNTPTRSVSAAWQEASLTLQTVCNCPGVERRPRSATTSLLPLRFVYFLVFQTLERSCFTKRLVNISVRTRWRQEGREGVEKRQEKTICASVVSASSVWVSKGPLRSTHNEECHLRGRKRCSLPFAFLFSLYLLFYRDLLTVEREGMRSGEEKMMEKWEEEERCWGSLRLRRDDPKDCDEWGWGAKREI